MIRKISFAASVFALFCTSMAAAQAAVGTCKAVDASGTRSYTITRVAGSPCKDEAGKEGDKDFTFCAHLNLASTSDDSTTNSSFALQCYAHENQKEEVTMSCMGNNGPFAVFAMKINDDKTFASSYIFQQFGAGKPNTVVTDRGTCTDDDS